ncbi:hypothetical protein GWI33_001116, partial [Rhynchophorus ferrugineus]
MDKKEFRVLI